MCHRYWGVKIGWIIAIALVAIAGASVGGLVWIRSSLAIYYIPSGSMLPTLQINDKIVVDKLAYSHSKPAFGDIVVYLRPLKATPDLHEEKEAVHRVIGVPGDTIRITGSSITIKGKYFSRRELASCLGSQATLPRMRLFRDRVEVESKGVSISEIAKVLEVDAASIKISPGEVYRNGKRLDEPYIAEDCEVEYPMPAFRSCQGATDPGLIITENGHRAVKIPEGMYLVMGDNRNDANDSRFWGLLEEERIRGKVRRIISTAGSDVSVR